MSHAAPAKAAPAATPSPAPEPPAADVVVLTAERLFVELASKAVVFADSNARIGAKPENLATLCFELSKAFHAVEVSRRVKAAPTGATIDVSMCDFDGWAAAAKN